jgi:hypothetical protein
MPALFAWSPIRASVEFGKRYREVVSTALLIAANEITG